MALKHQLMISPVHKYIKDFAEAGATYITFHPEASDDIGGTLDLIRSKFYRSKNVKILENLYKQFKLCNL